VNSRNKGGYMEEIERLKETILKEYPRLNKTSHFKFSCHKNISCFNKCCTDVNIFLTPYDIIRLKNKLKISSQEFLDRYTFLPIDENQNYPVVMLRLNADEEKACPFVSSSGCTVYEDRPWPCRMYPLGIASPKEFVENGDQEFYFILQETICQGYYEEKNQTVDDWIKEQQVDEYNEMGEHFKEVSLHDYFQKGKKLEPAKLEMFYTVCYNIDKFREFVFESTFLKRFEIDEEIIDKIKCDDKELLLFGFEWLKFCLFGEKNMKVKKSN
jgi:Fe-S-cluster containining protein